MFAQQPNQEQCCLYGILSILEGRNKKGERFVGCCDQVEDALDYIRQHLDISQPRPVQWTGGNDNRDEVQATDYISQMYEFPLNNDEKFVKRIEIPRGSWHQSATTKDGENLAIDDYGNPLNLNKIKLGKVINKGVLEVRLQNNKGTYILATTEFKEGDEFDNIDGQFRKSYELNEKETTNIMKLLENGKWDKITAFVEDIVAHVESVNRSIFSTSRLFSLRQDPRDYKNHLKVFKDKFLPFMYALLRIDEDTFNKVVKYNKEVWGLEPGTQIAQPLGMGGKIINEYPIPKKPGNIREHLKKKGFSKAALEPLSFRWKAFVSASQFLTWRNDTKRHAQGLDGLSQVEGKLHPNRWKELLVLEQTPVWKKFSQPEEYYAQNKFKINYWIDDLNQKRLDSYKKAAALIREGTARATARAKELLGLEWNKFRPEDAQNKFSINSWVKFLIASRPDSYKKAGSPKPQIVKNQLDYSVSNKFNKWVEQLRKELEDDTFIVERPQHHAVFIGFGLVTQVGHGDWCRERTSILRKAKTFKKFLEGSSAVAADLCLDVLMLYDFVVNRSDDDNIYPLYKVVYKHPTLIKSRLKRALEMATNPEWAYDVVGGNCQFWASFISQGKPQMTQVCRMDNETTVKDMELVEGFDDIKNKYAANLPKSKECRDEQCIVKYLRDGLSCSNEPKTANSICNKINPLAFFSERREKKEGDAYSPFIDRYDEQLVGDIANNVGKKAKKQYVCKGKGDDQSFYPCLLGEDKIKKFEKAEYLKIYFNPQEANR